MKTPFILTHPSFENVKTAAKHIVSQMDNEGFRATRIIALARGGNVLGTILSHRLNIPLTVVNYSSKRGRGDDRNHDNVLPLLTDKNIVVIDDLVDSGNSMKEVRDFYSTQNAKLAVMYAKEDSVIQPDYYWHFLPKNAPFIHFPWETE